MGIERRKSKKERKRSRRWYGITSMRQDTERIKAILKREGLNMFRKGGETLELQVKKKRIRERTKRKKGVAYRMNCKGREKNIHMGKSNSQWRKE